MAKAQTPSSCIGAVIASSSPRGAPGLYEDAVLAEPGTGLAEKGSHSGRAHSAMARAHHRVGSRKAAPRMKVTGPARRSRAGGAGHTRAHLDCGPRSDEGGPSKRRRRASSAGAQVDEISRRSNAGDGLK